MNILLSPAENALLFVIATVGVLALYWTVDCLKEAYRSDLSSLPGPKWAHYTSLYRVFRVWTGQAPAAYLDLHERYGPIVRTGPNTVSIADPTTIPVIYGISSNFLKGEVMESLFTTRDPAHHKALKKPVAGKFSMTSIRTLEPLVDECSLIFLESMRSLEGQVVDLGSWLQWYAFDVIGAITFNHRFGFMEERRDILDMISSIENALKYAAVCGQVPSVHRYLGGNQFLMRNLKRIPFLTIPDPLRDIVQGRQKSDFLTFLRLEEKKNKENLPHRDLINHLSNNLLAGSDTTAISLRAILYYIIQNPTSYKRLQEEIDEADRAGKLSKVVTYVESLDLQYLQVVMKEAMRCHPGVSYPLERLVPEGGAELCGASLRPGTVVGINPVVVHHNTEIYGSDAALFRPERWLEAEPEKLKVMERTLLTILREFNLYWASERSEWKVNTYWFAKQSEFFVRFESR